MLKYPELSNPEHTTALLDTLVEKKQLVKDVYKRQILNR